MYSFEDNKSNKFNVKVEKGLSVFLRPIKSEQDDRMISQMPLHRYQKRNRVFITNDEAIPSDLFIPKL